MPEHLGGILGVLITQTILGVWMLSWAVASIRSLTNEVKALMEAGAGRDAVLAKVLERVAIIEVRCSLMLSDKHMALSEREKDDP